MLRSVQIELVHNGIETASNYHHIYGKITTSNGYNGCPSLHFGPQNILIGTVVQYIFMQELNSELYPFQIMNLAYRLLTVTKNI